MVQNDHTAAKKESRQIDESMCRGAPPPVEAILFVHWIVWLSHLR